MTEDASSYDVRAELEDLLERDLLGPWDGPDEELPPGTPPAERYLLGRLVPGRSAGSLDPADPKESADLKDPCRCWRRRRSWRFGRRRRGRRRRSHRPGRG
ncbi:MAG TPA: hypothetical protein VG184_07540 [Acidimicrobiales bacterium]|nr:hypothetical protein [Acidimicrobiales bacterium]